MKYENNWRQQTLENLEKDVWPDIGVESDTQLVITCHKLRKIPLEKFTIENLRIMIGQQIGLFYLLPLAIAILKGNLLAEGDFYPGDLLNNILNIDIVFWKNHSVLWNEIHKLIADKRNLLCSKDIDISTHKFDSAFK